MKLIALIIVVSLLTYGGCATHADELGYSWIKTGPVASIINIHREDDWRKYPAECKATNRIWGCTVRTGFGGLVIADIYIRGDIETSPFLDHEWNHAKGLFHPEKNIYNPADFTRQ